MNEFIQSNRLNSVSTSHEDPQIRKLLIWKQTSYQNRIENMASLHIEMQGLRIEFWFWLFDNFVYVWDEYFHNSHNNICLDSILGIYFY